MGPRAACRHPDHRCEWLFYLVSSLPSQVTSANFVHPFDSNQMHLINVRLSLFL